MSHILYYGFCMSLVSSCGMGILYYFDKELASNIAGHVSWNMVKLYHYLNSKCNKTKETTYTHPLSFADIRRLQHGGGNS